MTVCECGERDSGCRRILKAAEEGFTESYIICPAAVVGPSTGPAPAYSFFLKFMVQFMLAFKKAIYVGEGENVFYTVGIPLPPHVCVCHLTYSPRRARCVWTIS